MNATPQEEQARIHKERGAELLAKGKLEPALREYELSIQSAPRDVVARRKVAEVLARLGRNADAVNAYQQLAGRFAAEGRLLEAIALCKVILQLEPAHRETQATLSRLYARREGGAPPLERLPKSMSGAIDMTHVKPSSRTFLPKPRLGLPGSQDGLEIDETDAGPMELVKSGVEYAEARPDAPKPASVRRPPPPPPEALKTGRGRDAPAASASAAGGDAQYARYARSAGTSTSPGQIDVAVSELPATPLFSELPEAVMQSLLERLTMIPFTAGENILVEGETGRSLFVLASGSVEVVHVTPEGKRLVIDHMDAGAFFGEIGLVADVPRLATVTALEDCMVLEVSREVIAEISQDFGFLQELVRRFYKERLLSNLIRQSPIFNSLTETERKAVVEKFGIRFAQPGEALLTQGERERGLFLLLRGRCGVSFRDVAGDDHPLPDMSEGTVMGEISLINSSPVTATVVAKTPVVLLFLEASAFVEHVLSNPKTRELITKLSEERLHRTEVLEEKMIERAFL